MTIKIKIDNTECIVEEGITVLEAIRTQGIYIPTLCDFKDLRPAGTCRLCTVKIGGRPTSSCTSYVADGMEIECKTQEVIEIRKALIEMLFVEGNHMCPTCEKSGDCELQAIAYRYKMMAPRFPFLFPNRDVDASLPKLFIEHNRCIQCLRCVRAIRTKDDKPIFGFEKRGKNIKITVDPEFGKKLSDKEAKKAMDVCPVGALLQKKRGFSTPIGERKFDKNQIGNNLQEN